MFCASSTRKSVVWMSETCFFIISCCWIESSKFIFWFDCLSCVELTKEIFMVKTWMLLRVVNPEKGWNYMNIYDFTSTTHSLVVSKKKKIFPNNFLKLSHYSIVSSILESPFRHFFWSREIKRIWEFLFLFSFHLYCIRYSLCPSTNSFL